MSKAMIVFFLIIQLLVSCAPRLTETTASPAYLRLSSFADQGKTMRHIELRDAGKLTYGENEIFLQDDREIMDRLKYGRKEKTAILGEYLFFRDEWHVSNKQYDTHFGTTRGRSEMLQKKVVVPVSIEALYCFSAMLIEGDVRFSPMLINSETGIIVNDSHEDIRNIYQIYRKWLDGQVKTQFKTLSWPLTGTKYKWYGMDNQVPLLRKEL